MRKKSIRNGVEVIDFKSKNWLNERHVKIQSERSNLPAITSGNNDYTISNFLDYDYNSRHSKVIAIDLSKQIELENPDLKQEINFIGKLEREGGAIMLFVI